MPTLKVFFSCIFFAGLLSFGLLIFPSALFAHETKSDGGIGAILHVDPGDAPIAGQQSSLFLEFTDMEDKLDLASCECEIIIKRGEQEILKQIFSEAEGSSKSAMIEFVFPESDVYKAIVTGRPKEEGNFQSFNLTFPIRVEKGGGNPLTEAHSQDGNTWIDHALHYLPSAILISGLILVLILVGKKRSLLILVLGLLVASHSLPFKAIHASHDGIIDHQAFVCCLPVASVMPEEPHIPIAEEQLPGYYLTEEKVDERSLLSAFYTRPPPLF